MTRFRLFGSERGTVMVLAGIALFPIMFLAAYAIDVSHWWDYSRNLQNRADAAALAGAAAYGNLCFAGSTPGDTQTGAQSNIGKWAQLYSGAGVGEPAGINPDQNVPYTDASVAAATGWNVTTNGYINNTKAGSPVNSPLTLRLGNLNNYWVVLNGRDYAENVPAGQRLDFTMNSAGDGSATFCNTDPKWDLTDPDRASAGGPFAMLDVKVSQRRLPLFFPLLSGRPTLHAHARVQLEGESSTPSEPIAVGDNGFTPCVSVNLVNATTNTVFQTVPLDRITPLTQSGPVTWSNQTAAPFTMLNSDNVYLQPFLNNCGTPPSGNTYDADTNSGLLYIDNYPATAPTVGPGDPPKIMPGGVTVSSGTPCPNATTQYFSNGTCTVSITAHVKFNPNLNKNDITLVAYDRQWDPATNAYTTTPIGNANQGMTQDNTDPTLWTQAFTFTDQTGMHQIELRYKQTGGAINGTTCSNANPCTGSLGVQQQVFAACNGCDEPDDSGPVVFARISDNGTSDTNAFAGGSSGHNLTITLVLAGLSVAQPGDPATVLRFPTSGNHQTGLIDCGQGTGANADFYVVYYGCGPQNPQFTPPLNSLVLNTRNTCGTPPGPPWPVAGTQDCVQTTPGTRRTGIICPLILRVTGEPVTANCTGQAGATCPENNWAKFNGSLPGGADPRALTFIVTSVADFGSVAGSPQGWVPIRRFATFYITGWDSNLKPQCPTQKTGNTITFYGNDPFPAAGKKSSDNAAVWGHWINYSDSAGTGNNQPCDLNSVTPTNCVPVLTR